MDIPELIAGRCHPSLEAVDDYQYGASRESSACRDSRCTQLGNEHASPNALHAEVNERSRSRTLFPGPRELEMYIVNAKAEAGDSVFHLRPPADHHASVTTSH